MDEKLAKKINRKLRLISWMLSFFSILILTALAVMGYFMWRGYQQINKVQNSWQSITNTSGNSLEKQLCSSSLATSLNLKCE